MKSPDPMKNDAERKGELEGVRHDYGAALAAGDGEAANRVLDELVARKRSLGEIYSRVIVPGLANIGDLWCRKEIGVAEEHLATQIALSHLDSLRSSFAWRERHSSYRVLIACVEGEQHWLGARMFADLCSSHGWTAEFLGPDVPAGALIDMVRKRAPQLLALSATIAPGLDHARRIVEDLAALANAPRVLLGGQAIAGRPFNQASVAVARDLLDGVEAALKFLRANRPKVILKEYLLALGRRVRHLRSRKGWTQEQLAEAARVTRVCIVSVEGGKQNVSMDIVVRLANALGVSPEGLLGPRDEPIHGPGRKS